jgi:hypothetical protein
MPNASNKIKLIVAAPVAAISESTDRGGGETHSLPSILKGAVSRVVEINPEDLRNNIDKCLQQMKHVFANLKGPAIDGWSVDSISVGLTISAEGSVGVATAGVEASIEIGFKPNRD